MPPPALPDLLRARRAAPPPRHRSASPRANRELRAAVTALAVAGGRVTVKGAAGMLGVTGLVAALVASPAIADPQGAHPTVGGSPSSATALSAPAAQAPLRQVYGEMGFVVVAKPMSKPMSKPKPEPKPMPKPKPKPVAPAADARASRSTGRLPTVSRVSGVGTAGLTSGARRVLAGVTSTFPQITNVIGVRPDSLPDHPSGHAIDFMIPSPFSSSGVALGTDVVSLVQAQAGQWNVMYVIYRQRIWFPGSGWRSMSDRGSPTANHMDHVHVTVN